MENYTYLSAVAISFAFALICSSAAYAQNLTSNASNAAGNASAAINQTGSELGENASDLGGKIVDGTEDVGKKIAGGIGNFFGNASEKLTNASK